MEFTNTLFSHLTRFLTPKTIKRAALEEYEVVCHNINDPQQRLAFEASFCDSFGRLREGHDDTCAMLFEIVRHSQPTSFLPYPEHVEDYTFRPGVTVHNSSLNTKTRILWSKASDKNIPWKSNHENMKAKDGETSTSTFHSNQLKRRYGFVLSYKIALNHHPESDMAHPTTSHFMLESLKDKTDKFLLTIDEKLTGSLKVESFFLYSLGPINRRIIPLSAREQVGSSASCVFACFSCAQVLP